MQASMGLTNIRAVGGGARKNTSQLFRVRYVHESHFEHFIDNVLLIYAFTNKHQNICHLDKIKSATETSEIRAPIAPE